MGRVRSYTGVKLPKFIKRIRFINILNYYYKSKNVLKEYLYLYLKA